MAHKHSGAARGNNRRAGMALALFLVLCGVLMVLAGSSGDSVVEVDDDDGMEHVKAAYEANVAVGRELEQGNLGDAKRFNRKALDELRPLVLEKAD